ncbi:MAG: uroporphyrinogen decarboxylase [Lachnospiraceae bacterium]|nr:uroporphyrinogen decarboxylase [Lachnospiraceae bacterium]MBQ6497033.1 uroporphyrinogen decarboxylase [Bacillota bacterium]
MLTKRQNLIETMKADGHPDRFVNQYEAFNLIMGSPFGLRNPNPKPGEENIVNAWGVTKSWPKGTPGAFPVHTPDKIVIKDIEEWQKYVKVPQVVYPAEEWEPWIKKFEEADRNEQFATAYFAPGVFEQCHYLMEIQNCLMAFYEYPDEMHELIDMITQFEIDYAVEFCKYCKPDALFHHDDWGTQISTFMSPDMFREFIKPAFTKIYKCWKDHGVQLIVHHSDSYAATLVDDMIDMGIDIWQGVMRTNNIPELVEKYKGRITFMGGIDSATIDYEGWTQEVVHDRVFEACKVGPHSFVPSASQGLPMSTYPGVYEATVVEIDNASKAYADFFK